LFAIDGSKNAEHSSQVSHGDHLKIGGLDVECLFTPCHTTGHICYLVRDSNGQVSRDSTTSHI
jgi:glyoxylase-like metal-dependent hydrolase (beta-lactamase superfamily II)